VGPLFDECCRNAGRLRAQPGLNSVLRIGAAAHLLALAGVQFLQGYFTYVKVLLPSPLDYFRRH
jgi:hypothetical protein